MTIDGARFDHGTRSGRGGAFTLVEVMMAVAIFVMCMFAILSLVSQNLRAARSLTIQTPHAGVLAAELALTNRLEEGSFSGDFGDLYKGYSWRSEITWLRSNGLFRVVYEVDNGREVESTLEVLTYKPQSPAPGLGSRR